jgi:DNA adenine methylase
MNATIDTTRLHGGPLQRYGGKGNNAPRIVPHFARAANYAEACLGAGGIFFRVPEGTYARAAVNDLDASLVGFFRALRDQPDELARLCSLTPYSRSEFAAALIRSDDPMEEARRVWVRGRQGYAGKAHSAGNWGRNPGDVTPWNPTGAVTKLDALHAYARRLLHVAIDCIDGAEFIAKWGREGTMVYVDPPYVASTRKGDAYLHELNDDGHRRFAAACHGAVERGARVCVSGYPSALYDALYAGWRRIDIDVALKSARHPNGQRRTESLWMSYPASEEIGAGPLSLTEGT